MENHGKYGELIYSYLNNDLYVNLFMSSRLTWSDKGLVFSQKTNFPDEEVTQLTIDSIKAPRTFSINVRYPVWVDPGKLDVKVNGVKVPVQVEPGAYVKLTRTWKQDDKIEVRLPMKLTTEELPDGSQFVAFLHGPIVLAAKTDNMSLDSLKGNGLDQFGGYRAKGKTYPLDSVPMLVSNESHLEKYLTPVPGKSQTFTATDLINPIEFKDLELIPFYKLHDGRYIIYWQRQSP